MIPMRSPSPSKPMPISALVVLTFLIRACMLWSSSGFASWFGKLPSGSQYSSVTIAPSLRRSSGMNGPAAPLPASITTLSGFFRFGLSFGTAWSRRARYAGHMSRPSSRPGDLGLWKGDLEVPGDLAAFGGCSARPASPPPNLAPSARPASPVCSAIFRIFWSSSPQTEWAVYGLPGRLATIFMPLYSFGLWLAVMFTPQSKSYPSKQVAK